MIYKLDVAYNYTLKKTYKQIMYISQGTDCELKKTRVDVIMFLGANSIFTTKRSNCIIFFNKKTKKIKLIIDNFHKNHNKITGQNHFTFMSFPSLK